MEALRIQGRVLMALMLREARTRYGRRQAGYLWALFEPLTHMAMFIAMFSFLARAVPLGDSLPAFLVTGLGPYLAFKNVMNRTQGAYSSNEALLSFPVVKVMDTFIGRALLELATGLTVTFILFTLLIATGYGHLPSNVLMMLSSTFLLFLIAFGAGVVIGILGQFLPSLATILGLPTRLLYWMSCIFYIPESMPPTARDIIAWNPVAHGVTMFRMGYYKLYDSHFLDVNYLCGWATSLMLAALIVERVARKPLRNIV